MSTSGQALFVLPDLHGAGTQQAMLRVVNALPELDVAVTLALGRAEGAFLDRVDPRVSVHDLGGSARMVFRLTRLLRREHFALVCPSITGTCLMTSLAARMAGVRETHVVPVVHNHLGAKTAAESFLLGAIRRRVVRVTLSLADQVGAVSTGIRDYLVGELGLPADQVTVLPNPVDVDWVCTRANEPLNHPWLQRGHGPLIVSVGRLDVQKDHVTLLRAFAQVRQAIPARLVILGEGPRRGTLEILINELHLQDDCLLPGFVGNPHAWMDRAQLFALSSRWEGYPLVLLEARALGLPIVATDCPSGPRELLDAFGGGSLCPVGDVDALADAMIRALSDSNAAAGHPADLASMSPLACARHYRALLQGVA